jgi:Tol biopolymer transport system component
MDAVKGTMSRVTMDNTSDTDPRLSPDGRSIIFASFRDATRSPFQIAIAGSPEPQLVFKFKGTMFANDDWTRDGKWLLYHDAGLPALLATPLDRPGDPPTTVAKALAGVVDQASMSPDGKFVIYSSTESGRSEIYLVRFPPTGDRWQVSPAGGTQPTWRGDGREVYYLAIDRKLMAVPLSTAGAVNVGDPVPLFVAPLREVSVGSEQYAPSPDGKRFLISVPEAGATPNRFAVLVNWQQLLASTP